MKRLCMLMACFCSGSLFAATIGGVEFELAPSPNEWELFARYDSNDESGNIEFPWGLDDSDDDDDDDDCDEGGHLACNAYMRKIGDNVEIFSAVWLADDEIEFETTEFFESFVTQELAFLFPNYQLKMKKISELPEHNLIEWEVHDGIQSIVQGLTRCLEVNRHSCAVLSYATQGVFSDEGKTFWIDVLNRAKSLL